MSQGHALPATHVAVNRVGSEIVNSFVFHDGISEPRGVAVTMTPAAITTALGLSADIKARSSALQRAKSSELSAPPMYTLVREPVAVHAVSAVVADDSEIVVLGFRAIEMMSTLGLPGDNGPVEIQHSIALEVSLSAPQFLAWTLELSKYVPEGQ